MKKSQQLQARSNDVIAGGALTNSKRPQSFVRGVYPTHLKEGIGAMVQDVDGKPYVDYICALGAILFGYRNPTIEQAVVEQISRRGPIFSLGTELEVEAAELFRNQFHFLQKIRFLKTGSEACAAAIRIARSFTGKKHVISDGYHGFHDEFTSLTPPASGVPPVFSKSISKLPADFSISNFDADVAAVIIEPVITDWSNQRIDWLHKLRDMTRQAGALLIFDETLTAIRFPHLSVAKYAGIDPDLCIMGKSIGGGYPLSLVGGRADVMSCDYFVSSTFAGDCVALSAAKAVMHLINDSGVMARLFNSSAKFTQRFNSIAPDLVRIVGYSTRGVFVGSEINKALFMQEMCKGGVLFGPSFFYGSEHDAHDDHVLSLSTAVLNRIKTGQVRLEGELPVQPFAQSVRER